MAGVPRVDKATLLLAICLAPPSQRLLIGPSSRLVNLFDFLGQSLKKISG